MNSKIVRSGDEFSGCSITYDKTAVERFLCFLGIVIGYGCGINSNCFVLVMKAIGE